MCEADEPATLLHDTSSSHREHALQKKVMTALRSEHCGHCKAIDEHYSGHCKAIDELGNVRINVWRKKYGQL